MYCLSRLLVATVANWPKYRLLASNVINVGLSVGQLIIGTGEKFQPGPGESTVDVYTAELPVDPLRIFFALELSSFCMQLE
jgi:hypothetical protein